MARTAADYYKSLSPEMQEKARKKFGGTKQFQKKVGNTKRPKATGNVPKPSFGRRGTPKSPSTPKPKGALPSETKTEAPKRGALQFGDVSGVSKAGQTTEGLRLSVGEVGVPRKEQELGTLSVFGEKAREVEGSTPGTLQKRNDIIASNLFGQGKIGQADVQSYLERQTGFADATPEEQANTVRAITERLGMMKMEAPTPMPEAERAPEAPTYDGVTEDFDKDFILEVDELRGEEKYIFDQLTPEQQKQYEMIGEEARRQGQNAAKAQMEYLAKRKDEKGYREETRERVKAVDALTGETLEIQRSERIKAAGDRVDNLKQNIAYLGQMGAPGASAVKMDAVANQIKDADTMFANLKTIEANAAKARELGLEGKAAAFEREMELMQDDLDKNVNEAIQGALDKFTAAEIEGKMDTVEEVEDLRIKLLNNLDESIAGITDANYNQRMFLLDEYDKIYEDAKEYQANSNMVNEELSSAQGFLMDMNGNPMISMETGQMIPSAKESPMKPIFDQASGQLIQFSLDEAGNIVANVDQVLDKASFAQNTIQGIANMVKAGELTPQQGQALLPGVDPAAFADAVAKAPGRSTAPGVPGIVSTFQAQTDGIPSTTAGGRSYSAVTQTTMQQGLDSRVNTYPDDAKGPRDGYCGQFVNDYLKSLGVSEGNLFIDPIEAKTEMVNSQTPTVGSVMIMDSKTAPKYGHVAVVTSVNADGTVNLKESNWGDDRTVHSRQNVDPNTLKVHGYFDPSLATEGAQKPSAAELAMFEKGAQYIGKKGGLTQERFNEIAEWQQTQEPELTKISPLDMKPAERDNLGFAVRLAETETSLEEIEEFISGMDTKTFLAQKAKPRFMRKDKYKKYEDSIRQFVNAQLRQESGAAIGEAEFESAEKEYFPQPGDSAGVLEQKKARRDLAVRNMLMKAGLQDFSQVSGYEKYSLLDEGPQDITATEEIVTGPTPISVQGYNLTVDYSAGR